MAPDLLGRYIVRQFGGQRLILRIVETEAYLGAQDRASHAWGGRRTKRSETLYSAPGVAYVYLIYGMYNCLNAVTGEAEVADAVLIRAGEPVKGGAKMAGNRALARDPRSGDLAGGPGKLCMALSIDRSHNARPLTSGSLRLTEGAPIAAADVASGPRVGIDYAEEAVSWPLRFAVRGNPHVSRPFL